MACGLCVAQVEALITEAMGRSTRAHGAEHALTRQLRHQLQLARGHASSTRRQAGSSSPSRAGVGGD
jgi:hypothetical protein